MYLWSCLALLACSLNIVNASINFGDKDSCIVIENGSTFEVAGNLRVTGTVVNNGTLTVDDGVHFDYSHGTLIDHGGTILHIVRDTTIYDNIELSVTSTLTIDSTGCGEDGVVHITGSGQKISFAQDGSSQLIIGENTTVVFENIELDGWHPDVVSFGPNASMVLSSSIVTLKRDVSDLGYSLVFEGTEEQPSYLRGNRHELGFSCESGSIQVGASDYVCVEEVNFVKAQGNIFDVSSGGTLTLDDCSVALVGDVTFNNGHLKIADTVTFLGSQGSFVYSSPVALSICRDSQLIFDHIGFAYSILEGVNAIHGNNKNNSVLVLQDAQLFVGTTMLTLSALKLVSRGQSVIYSADLNADPEINVWGTLVLGDGECALSNSRLVIETGILNLYDMGCVIQDTALC
jgi:hypothetical protein